MDKYAVGDIVKLKKAHPCGSSGNHACRRRLPPEMHGLRAPDYGSRKLVEKK